MRIRAITAAIIAITTQFAPLSAQPSDALHLGRELPATAIIPYHSQEEAQQGRAGSSAYVQPLEGWLKEAKGANMEYTIEFKRPFSWADRLQMVHIDGAGGDYNIYVNGRAVGWSRSGTTPCDFDVTQFAVEGNNSLKIEVVGNSPTRALENRQGSGRGRSVVSTALLGDSYIFSPPKVRIRDFVTATNIVPAGGLMEFGLILKSALLNTRSARLSYELFSPSGSLVSEGFRDAAIDMRREDTIRFLINVPVPEMWSHENPNLYTVVVKSVYDGRNTEFVSFKTAFVNVGQGAGRLTINGMPLAISAVEYEPQGDAQAVENELVQMKRQGVNMLKIIGGPQSEWFYSLCDRLGLYLCAQADINTHLSGSSIKLGGNPSNDPRWTQTYIDRVLDLYHTSKSHPSVVMFSLAENSANGIALYESYLALKKLEESRPIIYLGAGGEWNSDAVMFAPVALSEISQAAELSIGGVNISQGLFEIRNNMQFTTLHATVEYSVTAGRKKIASGKLKLEAAAESSVEFSVPTKKAKAGDQLNITFKATANGNTLSENFTATK